MTRFRYVLIGALVALPAPSAAQFAVDMEPAEIRRVTGEIVLSDLAVGDRGAFSFPTLCVSGGQLFIDAAASLDPDPSAYGYRWMVTRQPGNEVAMVVQLGEKSELNARDRAMAMVHGAIYRPCENLPWMSGRLFRVTTVNGKSSASEIAR